jgi:hypothetical protein
MEKYDFSGWATRNDLLCADGRTIRKDAFKHNDGQTVPLVWNHNHNDPDNILGHALLQNRDEGVYAYCTFNESDSGLAAKEAVRHGDVRSLSIYANKLKQSGGDVLHGMIREVSIVMAGANPGAFIDSVMLHGEDTEEGLIAGYDENIMIHYYTENEQPLQHADKTEDDKKSESKSEDNKEDNKNMADAKEKIAETPDTKETAKEKTVQDVFDEFTEEQKTVVYALIGQALEDAGVTDEDEKEEKVEHSEGGNNDMYNNVFDRNEVEETNYLSHADEMEILNNAKAVGSFKKAVEMWGNEHLQHGFGAEDGEKIDVLFTELKNVPAGAPTLLERDMDWVAHLMNKATKSPIARVRTRQIDARAAEITAKAHTKGEQKKAMANVKLLKRETHPQTVYVKDALHRDDIQDMDFDGVAYMRNIMKHTLEETVALAALVGDHRNEEADKISDQSIRPIWTDEDVYAIHETVDFADMKTKLQGTNTAANFGDEFVKSEAIIAALMKGRIQYKGKGVADFYCSPELLNTMLMARDMNGRRIYDSAADLCKVLNVARIFDVDQIAGLQREDSEGNKFNLLGIFVNMANYQFGCAKGGEITSFEDFDIDYNQYKYLMETRLSGALIDPYSAIVLEEAVAAG